MGLREFQNYQYVEIRGVWQLCDLPCVYALFKLISIARYVFKSLCICLQAGLLIFRVVAEPRISSKSAKSHEIHKNTKNPAKFAKNLTKYMSAQHIWKLSWLLGLLTCCKLANLPWNFVTAASKNNIPKLPGVLRLMLRKTGKQRCKNPGVPDVDRENWGWECDSLFHRVFALLEECCVLWRITPYMFISPTKSERFGAQMIMPENLQNEQSSCSFSRDNK